MLTVALLPTAFNDAPAADGANTILVHKAVPIGGSSGDHHHHCVFSRDQGDYSAGSWAVPRGVLRFALKFNYCHLVVSSPRSCFFISTRPLLFHWKFIISRPRWWLDMCPVRVDGDCPPMGEGIGIKHQVLHG